MLSLPKAPEQVLLRDAVGSSDNVDFNTGITKAMACKSNGHKYAILYFELGGTAIPTDVDVQITLWDEGLGEFVKWENNVLNDIDSNVAWTVEVDGQPFFVHLTITGGTDPTVTVRASGFENRLEAA